MHGRVKVKAPKELQAERQAQEQALAEKFKLDLDKAWEKRESKSFDSDTVLLTGKILLQNADYQTIWNFRREIILHWKENGLPTKEEDLVESSSESAIESPVKVLDMEKVYMDELKFTSSCLIKHPKSYGTWYHRQWAIKEMANPPFKEEIMACNHFLDLDERNFHCWDYRRFICTYGKIDLENELQFTQKKIQQNFSNFSSFYYRSSLLTLAHNEGILDINDYWDSDYETIINAIFVDPNDQSPWFYHKWLLAADQLINATPSEPETLLYKIILDSSRSLAIYQFHQPLKEPPFKSISIVTKDEQSISCDDINWKQLSPISSYLWYHQIDNCEIIDSLSFIYSDKPFTIKLTDFDDKSNLRVNVISPMVKRKPVNPQSKLDSTKLNNLKLLLEMEPDNKWINLTMSLISGEPDETVFDQLIQIDPLRVNYYKDQRSKQIIEKKLQNYRMESQLFLNGLNLTNLYFTHYLTHLRFLDLSNNNFVQISASFNTLIALETLILDQNEIKMVANQLAMLSLKKLSLKNNRIVSYSDLTPLLNCPLLQVLDLTNNPVKSQGNDNLPLFNDQIKLI